MQKSFPHTCRCVSRHELEFVANTVVFVLSGVIIAARVYNSEHTAQSLIQPQDYGYAFLLWVYLTVCPVVSQYRPPPPETTLDTKFSPVAASPSSFATFLSILAVF